MIKVVRQEVMSARELDERCGAVNEPGLSYRGADVSGMLLRCRQELWIYSVRSFYIPV